MNELGDLTLAEFKDRQGLKSENDVKPDKKKIEKEKKKREKKKKGRKLQQDDGSDYTTASINYAEMGYVGPVKSQGACGTCWALAARTVEESN